MSLGGMMIDRFRKQPAKLNAAQLTRVDQIKSGAAVLEAIYCDPTADKRCMAIALTKLEESVMWATKGITAP